MPRAPSHPHSCGVESGAALLRASSGQQGQGAPQGEGLERHAALGDLGAQATLEGLLGEGCGAYQRGDNLEEVEGEEQRVSMHGRRLVAKVGGEGWRRRLAAAIQGSQGPILA